MNFDLDDQQQMLRDLVARFVADRSHSEARTAGLRAPEGFSDENWAFLGELGLLALPFGEAAGGAGGSWVDLITVAEQLGRGVAVEPYLSDLLLAGRLLESAGSDSQREQWLPRIMAGAGRVALAHVEPKARYDPLYVTTAAKPGGLFGHKTLVLAGEGVDAFIVSARDGGGVADAQGIGLWLVPADAAGLERHAYRLTDGTVALELWLHGVTDAERLPGEAAAGLLRVFDEARVAVCAEMVGIMEVLLAATLDHVRTRRQFGQAIGSFQAIQHQLADLYVLVEQSRSHLLRAALSGDDAMRGAVIAGAKSFVSESAVRVGEACIQLHGGMGVTNELAIGQGHKRILLLANLLGDADTELARYVQLTAKS